MSSSDKDKTINFQFQYRITYGNGKSYDWPHVMNVQITMDEYKMIVLGVIKGKRISEIDDISESIKKMTEIVHDIDSWSNLNGSNRTKPLKKARNILELEFFLTRTDYQRFKKMQNPMEVLERPEDFMTIYRNDGSSVLISYEYGQVKIVDSRNPRLRRIHDADNFLSIIV